MQVGAWAVGTMTISGLLGKAVLAILGDRVDPRYLWAAFCATFGVGMISWSARARRPWSPSQRSAWVSGSAAASSR